jgi:hypothetical protein
MNTGNMTRRGFVGRIVGGLAAAAGLVGLAPRVEAVPLAIPASPVAVPADEAGTDIAGHLSGDWHGGPRSPLGRCDLCGAPASQFTCDSVEVTGPGDLYRTYVPGLRHLRCDDHRR